MTDTSTTSDMMASQLPAAPAAAPSSYQPVGMPVTPPEYGHPEAVAARARIDELKADKAFYQKLQAESDRGVSGEARQEWNRLHAVGFPSPTSITSPADVDVQAAARNAEQWNSFFAAVEQRVALTDEQRAEIRSGEVNAGVHRWALDEIARLTKDKGFYRRLLDGDRAANRDWEMLKLIRGLRPVDRITHPGAR